MEAEPNNSVRSPNVLPIDKWVQGAVANRNDVDYFTFKTPKTYRDKLKVEVRNQSTTLRNSVRLYGVQKNKFWEQSGYYLTPGQDLAYTFSVAPN